MKNQFLVLFFLGLLVGACKTSEPIATSGSEDDVDEQLVNQLDSLEIEYIEEVDPPYQPTPTRLFDLIHTKLEVQFDWSREQLIGQASLELRPFFYPQETVTLDAKGFEIKDVKLIGPSDSLNLNFEYDSLELFVQLDKTYQREEKFVLYINYVAKPSERLSNGSDAITSDRGLYFINSSGANPYKPQQIWTQGETQSNSNWFPTIDRPNERCTQEIYITVEDRFNTLSNGELVYSRKNGNGTRTDYWKMDLPHAPYLFMMTIGEFAVVDDRAGEIPLQYYVEPEFEPYAKDIFGNTPEMMAYFEEILDYPYPWPKYSQVVVRDFVSGAMENTTATVFMENVQLSKRELIDLNWEDIIAHELFHHWFGDLVTCESWSNLPLNEGFANYSEYLWYEYKYGLEEADYKGLEELESYLLESEDKQEDLIRFYYDDREDMFDNHSYAKAGRVLHMLRMFVGNEAFFEALNIYLKQNAYKSVEIHQLRLAFEEVTGEDLNWFFDQWYLASGHPELEVEHTYLDDTLYIEVLQVQDLETTPLYVLPLHIDVWVGNKMERVPLMIESEEELYAFYYEQEPENVLFDSDQQLLGVVSHQKDAQSWLHQYRNAERVTARYNALQEVMGLDADSVQQLMVTEALDDRFWAIREYALQLTDEAELIGDSTLMQRVIDLVNDSNSMVRAEALNTLLLDDLLKHEEIFRNALLDSSYTVNGVALGGLLESGFEVDSLQLVEFESVRNINVVLSLADHYLINNRFDKYDWFVGKTHQLNSYDLFYFLQYYVEYLISAPTDQREHSVEVLAELATTNNNFFVKLASYQGLALLADLEGVKERMREIKENETDLRLLEYYEVY